MTSCSRASVLNEIRILIHETVEASSLDVQAEHTGQHTISLKSLVPAWRS